MWTTKSPPTGPQLVVPILNARFALNAANARWGSLYDALYGTDVIPEADGAEKASADTGGYNKVRGDKVIAYAREVLDGAAPLASGSWKDAVGLKIDDGQLLVELGDEFSTACRTPINSWATPASSVSRSGRCY